MHATLDPERARYNMIEQQIRPWGVLDQQVLDLLAVVKREEFVAPSQRAHAFADTELPIIVDGRDTGEIMFAPKLDARLVQDLGLRTDDNVLEIGTGSGYLTALLAHRTHHVTSVEIDPTIRAFAQSNLRRAAILNATLIDGDGARGFATSTPPDVIVLSGGVPFVPETFLRQLRIGGRLAAIVGDVPVMTAQIVTRTGSDSFDTLNLFETLVPPLHNVLHPPRFKF